MPDLIDDIRTTNENPDVQNVLAHMAPDKDYKKLAIPFHNWNVTIFYSEDENGNKHWEQSLRSPGPGHPETLKYYGPKNKGEANDVLPERSSTSKPAPSRENPGYAG